MKRRSFLNKSVVLGAAVIFPKTFFACRKKEDGNIQNGNILNEFDRRRDFLLRNTAGVNISPDQIKNPLADIYSNRAIANLVLKRYIQEANEHIRYTARWFEHYPPHPHDNKGECDFTALKLCRAAYLFRDKPELEDETRKLIKSFFLTQDFESIHGSENHGFMFRVSRYLMAQMLPDELFLAYEKTGRLLVQEDGLWLKDFLRYRARRGWGEFDSSVYMAVEMEALLILFDYTADQEMKHLAEMMIDLLLADISVDSLNGMYCGAQGRIYMQMATDHADESTMVYQYIYFGLREENMIGKSISIDPLVSEYRPKEILINIALDRPDTYENLERKHLHNIHDIRPEKPLEGSIRKYTYYTPQFVMGAVQLQDHYPDDNPAKWYAYHQQHDWDLSFAASTRARIFTHHPGNTDVHDYWTGDLGCECGSFFQHKKAVVCVYDISEEQVYHFIHAYLPKNEFEEVKEIDGWFFVRSGSSYAALKLLGETPVWTTEGNWANKEIISQGRKNGSVCEVGQKDEFGSFENFCTQILSNQIEFDPGQLKLTYHSKQNGKLTIDTKGLRLVNDKPVDLNYPLFRSPYMDSEWDSGLITIKKDDQRLELDFR